MYGLSPPTDNLYKFFAISGVAIVLVSFVATQAARDSAMSAAMDRNRDIETIVQEVQAVLHDEKMKGQAWVIGRDRPAEPNYDEDKHYIALDANLKTLGDEKPQLRPIRKKNTELYWASKKDVFLKERAATYERLSQFGVGVGSAFAVLGFGLWYFKVQRYQDAMLKAGQRPPV